MKKIDLIIKIGVIIIAVCILFNTILGTYYEVKYTIRNHDQREMICNLHEDLVYIKSLQFSNEIVKCCELSKEQGVNYIISCEEILI